MTASSKPLENIQKKYFSDEYRALAWSGTLADYLNIVKKNPEVIRSSYQRLYDMITSYGITEYEDSRKKMIHYNFFDDPIDSGKDAVYGLDAYLMKLMNIIKAAAHRYGTERRVILLHGPVGSAKSTIVRLMKKGLEQYSKTDQGALYSFEWIDIPKHFNEYETSPKEHVYCPMFEEPLHLIAANNRANLVKDLLGDKSLDYVVEGDLCPSCRQIFQELNMIYSGDVQKIFEHIKVRRSILSEKERVGIVTFHPND